MDSVASIPRGALRFGTTPPPRKVSTTGRIRNPAASLARSNSSLSPPAKPKSTVNLLAAQTKSAARNYLLLTRGNNQKRVCFIRSEVPVFFTTRANGTLLTTRSFTNQPWTGIAQEVRRRRLSGMEEVRPATGQALIEPSWPKHRILVDANHRAFLLRS